jgi:ATP-dependent Clp protease ATP-binding subunit ClpA
MSAQCPLNSTTVDVLGQYNDAAKHLIAAYRFGTARAVAGAGERYAQFLDGRSLVSAEVKAKLIGAEQKVGQFVVGAVGRISDRADALVDGVAKRATTGVERFDNLTAWSHDSTVFNALRKLNMPAAKASLGVAEKVADLSRRLSARVAGQPEAVSKVAKAVKSTARKTRTAVKSTRRTARASA